MSNIEYTVTKRYGKIDRGDSKWPLEVTEVSWNGRPPKVDIRFWTPDAKPRKGITHGRPNYLTIHYAQIAKSCGVDSFLHKLRHTFASQLVQNGVELYTVSKLLGHSSIQMTEIYAHMAPPTLHRAIAKLPERQIQPK